MNRIGPTHQIVEDVLVPRALAGPGLGGRAAGDCLRGDLLIRDGVVAQLKPGANRGAARGIVLPHLVEPHVHLDKCHTIDRMDYGIDYMPDGLGKQVEVMFAFEALRQ